MRPYRFLSPQGKEASPQQWLLAWAALYPANDYGDYAALIAKHKSFSSSDFVRIGKWKDGVKTEGRWKANVASVAYPIWMQTASEMPKLPASDGVPAFLNDWASRSYTDQYAPRRVTKHFGLSRASTLLHFVTGGEFPIFDSRVRTAIMRLLGPPVENTVEYYLKSYCPIFQEIASVCEAKKLRKVDMALFSYGGRKVALVA